MAIVTFEEVKNGMTPYVNDENFRKYVLQNMRRKGQRAINEETIAEMYIKFHDPEYKPPRYNMPEHTQLIDEIEYKPYASDPDLFWVREYSEMIGEIATGVTVSEMIRRHGKNAVATLHKLLFGYYCENKNTLVPLPQLKRFFAVMEFRGV